MSSPKPMGRPLGATEALQIMFLGFKLAHVGDVAAWSWWEVLLPIEIWLALLVLVTTLNAINRVRDEREAERKRRREALRL